MLVQGIDLSGWPGGLLTAAHSTRDVEDTIEAFDRSLHLLEGEGLISVVARGR